MRTSHFNKDQISVSSPDTNASGMVHLVFVTFERTAIHIASMTRSI